MGAEPLAWGIVGPGAIADVFATALHRAGIGRIAAAYGRSSSRRDAFCRRHGGVSTDSLAALVEHPEVQAVYIASPHVAHGEAVRAALESGRAVLCEKPMTTDPTETQTLTDLARERSVALVEGWMYRTHPQIDRLVAFIREAPYGAVRSIESQFGFVADPDATRLHDPTLGGGAILDVGGYPVSVALLVAGALGLDEEPTWTDLTGRMSASGVDATARGILKWSNGMTAHLSTSIEHDLGMTARVEFEQATVDLEHPFLPAGERLGTTTAVRVRTATSDERLHIASDHDCFALEAMALTRLVHAGAIEPSYPMVDHATSNRIARLLDAWRAAVRATPTTGAS